MSQRKLTNSSLPLPSAQICDRCNVTGFTLIELLVVISIVGILALAAMSGFSSWLFRAKSEELTYDLQRSFSLARSAAIKHGGRVRLCGSSDGASCTNSFDQGWIVYLDADNSQQVEDSDTIIRVFANNSTLFSVSMEKQLGPTTIQGVSFNFKGYADTTVVATLSAGALTQTFIVNRNGNIQ